MTASTLDSFTHVKNYIYNNPVYKVSDTESVPIDLTKMANIIGIYLRDLYLQKHPELSTS